MANPHRGEYSFDVDGQSHVLRFSADIICDIEDQLDMTLAEISERLQKPETLRMSMVRKMFVTGLQSGSPEERAALFGKILPIEAVEYVANAFSLAFGIDPKNPPQPGTVTEVTTTNGIGPASTQNGSSSDLTQSSSGAKPQVRSAG